MGLIEQNRAVHLARESDTSNSRRVLRESRYRFVYRIPPSIGMLFAHQRVGA